MIRDITIKPALNGFICNVGCRQVVFTDRQTLVAAFAKYLDDPEATELYYLQHAVNVEDQPKQAQACDPECCPETFPGTGLLPTANPADNSPTPPHAQALNKMPVPEPNP